MRFVLLAIPVVLAACDSGDSKPPAPVSVDRAKDPVCSMMVEKTAPHKAAHEGTTYYFCAEECLKKFQADPAKYAVHCSCGKTAKKCGCGHCAPKGETCDCG